MIVVNVAIVGLTSVLVVLRLVVAMLVVCAERACRTVVCAQACHSPTFKCFGVTRNRGSLAIVSRVS